MTRIVPLALLLLLAPSLASAQQSEALLIGSSSVNGTIGRTIERELGAAGVRVTRHARSASGFARPDFFDWRQEVSRLGRLDRYRAVLVYTGGNDGQGLRLQPDERREGEERVRWVEWRDEARWRSTYAQRVRTVVDELCAAGAPRVIVLLPVDGGAAGWWRRMERVRAGMIDGVRGTRCGTVLDASSSGEVFDSSDGVHLTWRGATRMWARIGDRLVSLVAGTRS